MIDHSLIPSKPGTRRSSTRAKPAKENTSTASEQDIQVVATDLSVAEVAHPAREQLIAEAAYHHAEARGFEPGHELEDWLAAEAEVDARLCGEGRSY